MGFFFLEERERVFSFSPSTVEIRFNSQRSTPINGIDSNADRPSPRGDLFSDPDQSLNRASCLPNCFPRLSPDVLTQLGHPYSTQEIYQALKVMGSLKAPGPDGFQLLFFQKFWTLLGSTVCDMVLDSLAGRGLPDNLNHTHITLIPKTDHPEMVFQFRPIGLCNVSYKLITKVIAQRLNGVLPDLISPSQSSFIPGRQISDNVVIMHEVLHSICTLIHRWSVEQIGDKIVKITQARA